MSRRGGGLIPNLALAAAALVLAFAIPEAILRIARPRIAHDLFGTAGEHLPGLREMAAETERYARARGIRQPPNFIEASDLLWSLKPGYDESITRIPWVEGEPRTYRVRVNSRGFRGPEFAPGKASGTVRVVCLGDSIIFGDKLGEGRTIPEDLARILAARAHGRPVEVINAGVPGYSSRQGLEMWRTSVRDLRPDVVTIAYGFNDQWPSAVSDAGHFPPDLPGIGRALGWLRRTETYRTLRAVILAARRRVNPGRTAAGPVGTRVSLAETQANVRALTREARAAGARVVIVHTATGRDAVRATLARVAREEGVPFVDSSAVLEREKESRQRALAARLGLSGRCPEPPRTDAGFLFRVILPPAIPRRGDLRARAFGDVVAVILPLMDNGLGCDEHPGDGVWTGWLAARPDAVVHYLYAQALPGGRESQEFDAFPWAWRTRAATPRDAGGPIDTYNRYDLMSEEIHPDAEGAAVMARAIAAAIEGALARKAGAAP